MTQEKALEILKSGRNIFLTGIAGAGKTYTLIQFIEYCKEQKIRFAVTASTGIVAAAIDGVTIHSFSALGVRDTLTISDLERIKNNPDSSARIKDIQVLIIDEISMLSEVQLDLIDRIFKHVRKDKNPFGGVQIVFCGDFLQLPPVRGNYAFQSEAWQDCELAICYLDQAYRQKEGGLLDVLNAIRSNQVNDNIKAMINERVGKKLKDSTKLYTHNIDVDAYNQKELDKVKGKSQSFKMTTEGESKYTDALKKSCLSPDNLELKVGAKVIVTKNNFNEGLVNGTMGTVKKLNKQSVDIITLDGREVTLEPAKWSVTSKHGKPIASIYQIPLRLAYAITIHKSQGMTLDAATMNLAKIFQTGQGYVALSRLRSLEFLSLEDTVSDYTFRISQECFEYEKKIIQQSKLL